MNVTVRIALASLLTLPAHGLHAQQAYPNPDAAAQALVAALGSQHADAKRMAQLLGADWQTYIPTDSIERQDVDAFLALYKQKRQIQHDSTNQAHLVVGNNAWSFPLPLIKGQDGWHFDPKIGGEEIRARRIGRNELTTIQSLLAYDDAQMDYAEVDRNGDGILEYAQQFISSPGKHDGLYWSAAPDGEQSPLGPLFGNDVSRHDWHGYHYRILSAQGASAPGGAYSYKLGEHMSRGFAAIAWPSAYGDSGIMSFMISHDGQVYEKDLGPDGEKLATAMQRFDPDSSWRASDEALAP